MSCSDPRKSEKELAREAFEEMDEYALASMTQTMEDVLQELPPVRRAKLKIVKKGVGRPAKK
jgi:hypothetical protein